MSIRSSASTGLPVDADNDLRRVDIVLGDRGGTSCAPVISDCVETTLSGLGYRVTRNNPYSGGFTTQHYGDPSNGVHAIQIEINRNIYMDEVTLRRREVFPNLKADINTMVRQVAATAALQQHRLRYERLSAE